MQHDIVLTRGSITLRPLHADDASAFRAMVDEASWAGMAVRMPADDAAMRDHLDGVISQPAALAFAVEREGELVGRTTFYELTGARVEIGNTIYARPVWGSTLNPTAKFLLFEHAFEVMGLKRVALRCDSRNERSHKAILRLGATYEGTLRSFRPAADGTLADVDYFSVLEHEWPKVRQGLLARIDG